MSIGNPRSRSVEQAYRCHCRHSRREEVSLPTVNLRALTLCTVAVSTDPFAHPEAIIIA